MTPDENRRIVSELIVSELTVIARRCGDLLVLLPSAHQERGESLLVEIVERIIALPSAHRRHPDDDTPRFHH